MSKLPIVAIIGRPNTGKSTLFNRMIGERRAIVSDVPGTTRDHILHRIETDDVDYLLLDTGGMGGGTLRPPKADSGQTDDRDFEEDVHAQSLLAVQTADVIVLTMSSREELTGSDRELASLLRKRKRKHVPVILAVTKVDDIRKTDDAILPFHELGIAEDIIPVSAVHGSGIGELEDVIVEQLKKMHFAKVVPSPNPPPERGSERAGEVRIPKIALIGRPNVGKSSVINALMSEPQRKTSPRLVSEVPGTTRDTTDTVIKHEDKEYLFLDTAGLKKHGRKEEGIEYFAMLRTIEAIEQSDIAILLLDATEPVSHQDKRIARMTLDAGKGLIILLNKADLLNAEQKEERKADVQSSLLFCRYAPVLFSSATTREGLLKIFPLLEMIHRNRLRRIATKDLHRWLSDSVEGRPVGALASCKYLAQAEDPPPTFVLFVKDPKKIQLSQLRYLDRRLREVFDFTGTPVRWITKASGREKA